MIKIFNIDHFESIKNAQSNVGAYSNYLIDILKPAIERGDWDEFEQLDIGFDTTGQSLGKIGDNKAWKKLQSFFEPNTSSFKSLDFSLNAKVIERNLQNELKAIILKMMWISPKDYSFETLYLTLIVLKKFIEPLLLKGVNSFFHIDFDCLERWVLESSTELEFRREHTYSPINKLFIEKKGLPFNVSLMSTLAASDFNLTLIENEQYPVIPLRLYYRALCKAESLINSLYPILDEVEELSTYLLNFSDNIYKGYTKYLHKGMKKHPTGKLIWRLSNSNKYDKTKNKAFMESFNELESPTEIQILALLQEHQPIVKANFYDKCYPEREITVGGKTLSYPSQVKSLLMAYSGGCLWTLIAKSGMRIDEAYHLHTVNGCKKEVISGQTIYVLNTDLSKTIKGSQSKQDEFVTSNLGMKAYEILQAIHKPLRKHHSDSTKFFHKLNGDFNASRKCSISKKAKKWFHTTLANELALTNEDIKDLKLSTPAQDFELGKTYEFCCHQLRRSFAYYLIGYELLSFPQLKQQFSHVSLAMTRHYAKYASKFQKLRKKKVKNINLCSVIGNERVNQKAKIYLNIYQKFANKERVAGGKGKEFAKRMIEKGTNAFTDGDKYNNMLTLAYWENVIRDGQRHIHVVAPGIYCTSSNCSLRTQVNLMECVDCANDYVVDAVYAEAMRKEAETHIYYDIQHNELTPQAASESYIKIKAAERIMNDLGIDYEPVVLPKQVQDLLIPYTGVTV